MGKKAPAAVSSSWGDRCTEEEEEEDGEEGRRRFPPMDICLGTNHAAAAISGWSRCRGRSTEGVLFCLFSGQEGRTGDVFCG